MSWWCAATDRAWTWTWRPYLGAWVVAAVLVVLLVRGWRREPSVQTRRIVAGLAGVVLLLVATEWPLATMGAGYLVSAQMARQVIVVLIAVPLLLYAAPPSLGRWIEAQPRRQRLVDRLTAPVLAIVLANVLLVAANTPVVVDRMIGSQIGSFVVDAVWVVAGLLLWLPVQPPRPLAPRLVGPPATAYLIVQSVAPLVPAFFMTWATFPIYATYELAPRVWREVDPVTDQETAAAVMQGIGGFVMWTQIAARFIGWALREERDGSRGGTLDAPSEWVDDDDGRQVATTGTSVGQDG